MVKNRRRYTVMEQLASLKANFRGGKSVIGPNGFTWRFKVMPTPLSCSYTLKIVYCQNSLPKIYVEDPKPLPLAIGADRLPHTYDTHSQRLCLYCPQFNEWNSQMLLSNTIVHWAFEWLIYYEEWLYSGKWYGGGHGSWDAQPNEINAYSK